MRRTRETAGVLDSFVDAGASARVDSETMARVCVWVSSVISGYVALMITAWSTKD